jgi:3-hydroxyisobutyrate dehydrogenase-like beta-hydroxyacid dehydrogenase
MSTHLQIGIAGCGLLGSALCDRYLAAGFSVRGFDIDSGTMARFPGEHATSLRDFPDCGRIVLCLPNSLVSAVVLAELDLKAGMIVIDSTTGDPGEMAGFAQMLAARGVGYLDASIGGSSKQVRAGEAIAIVGGDANAFAACRPLFAAFAARTFHVGEAGSGARMKLVLNLVVGLNRAVLAEGLTFAKRSGIDPALALEILKSGPAYSKAMDVKGQKMLSEDFTAEARLSQHLKDVRLILDQARRQGRPLPLSELHRTLLEKAEAAGFGAADNSAVIKAFDI